MTDDQLRFSTVVVDNSDPRSTGPSTPDDSRVAGVAEFAGDTVDRVDDTDPRAPIAEPSNGPGVARFVLSVGLIIL